MLIKIVSSEDIIGTHIKNDKGEKLGKIESILFDKLHGRVAFVVLYFNGFLEINDKLFVLPWSMLTYDNANDCFKVPISKEKLKNSPGFDKNHWPNISDIKWSNSIYSYYGINARYPDQH